MRTRMRTMRRNRRAVTLTELLVVVAIIGLLATLAVPVLLTQMLRARVRTAQFECMELAMAETTCAIFHGFYVPLQLLDDLARPDRGTGFVSVPPADSLENEPVSNILLIDPFLPASAQVTVAQLTLADAGTVQRVANLVQNWQGPFVTVHRQFARPASLGAGQTSADVRRDFPMDPWEQPYRFFSAIGPIGTNSMTQSQTVMYTDTFSDGRIINDPSNAPFDRWTIVSFGPNGVLDNPQDPLNDDIFYEFGMVFDATTFYRPLIRNL